MRLAVRAGLVVAGAAGFCAVLSLAASAEVVEPSAVYQPASAALTEEGREAAAPKEASKPAPSAPKPAPEGKGEAPQPKVQAQEPSPATPAPEPQVKPAPAEITPREPAPRIPVVTSAVRPLVIGFQHIGSYLDRVVSACQVAVGSGAGGPVLVLGVLSLVTALARRRVLGTWSTTDEDMPELLFANEVIKPG